MKTSDVNNLVSIDSLREFIKIEILGDSSLVIADEQDLLITGLLDSMSVVRLMSFIEQTGSITIPPEDLLLENFGSLNQIDAYLKTYEAEP